MWHVYGAEGCGYDVDTVGVDVGGVCMTGVVERKDVRRGCICLGKRERVCWFL